MDKAKALVRRSRWACLCLIAGCVLAGCEAVCLRYGTGDEVGVKALNKSEAEVRRGIPLSQNLRSSASDDIYSGKSLEELIALLRTTPGVFSGPLINEFSGDTRLFEAIGEYKDSAVEKLVDCLDNTEPTAVMWGDQPVQFGVICYVALRHVAYYEHEISEEWPGDLIELPMATAEMIAAQKAWRKVVKEKSYNLL